MYVSNESKNPVLVRCSAAVWNPLSRPCQLSAQPIDVAGGPALTGRCCFLPFRTTHEVVQADGFLYAVGGNDGSSSLNTVERYDPRHNKWMLVTAMMLRRSSVGAAVLDCPVLERSAQERSYSTSTASSEP